MQRTTLSLCTKNQIHSTLLKWHSSSAASSLVLQTVKRLETSWYRWSCSISVLQDRHHSRYYVVGCVCFDWSMTLKLSWMQLQTFRSVNSCRMFSVFFQLQMVKSEYLSMTQMVLRSIIKLIIIEGCMQTGPFFKQNKSKCCQQNEDILNKVWVLLFQKCECQSSVEDK